jgi:acyl dehydratase
MALEHLEGATYGPRPVTISPAKVGEYVAATGDDSQRWIEFAPPGYAGALLFVIAPDFLSSDAVVGHTSVLIHADQTFVWHAALGVGRRAEITGRIDRVRSRGGVDFVSFAASVSAEDGSTILDSSSTFLLGAEPAGQPPEARHEPAVAMAASNDPLPATIDGAWPAVTRSVSRLDLVKYAAASGDFNPIHFDHDAAVGAGLPGIVAHGLLMGAWLLQPPAALRGSDRPLERAKLRFRDPLFPGVAATLSGSLRESGTDADLELVDSGGAVLVTAQVRLAGE